MTSFSSRLLRSLGVAGLVFLAFCLTYPQEAQGQRWLQTARVLTPIEDGPKRVFLDTLVNVMGRNEVRVRRSPDQEEKMTLSSLRNKLISEEGIGLGSANYVFIGYRFTIDNGGQFEQEVATLRFVFRPGPDQNDVSMMYVDAQEPWVEEVIQQKGTSLRSNQAALIPFHRHLGFARIARRETSQVVDIGGQTVRDEFDARKRALIQKVERLTYESFV